MGAALQHLLQNLKGKGKEKKLHMKTEADASGAIVCITTCSEDAIPVQVFVTDHGEKLHSQAHCRGLNAAHRVRALKVRAMKPCKFCGF